MQRTLILQPSPDPCAHRQAGHEHDAQRGGDKWGSGPKGHSHSDWREHDPTNDVPKLAHSVPPYYAVAQNGAAKCLTCVYVCGEDAGEKAEKKDGCFFHFGSTRLMLRFVFAKTAFA